MKLIDFDAQKEIFKAYHGKFQNSRSQDWPNMEYPQTLVPFQFRRYGCNEAPICDIIVFDESVQMEGLLLPGKKFRLKGYMPTISAQQLVLPEADDTPPEDELTKKKNK